MEIGTLTFRPIQKGNALVARPVQASLEASDISSLVFVTSIDPELADTAAFCKAYGVGMNISANCLIVEAKRADKTWYAACLVLAPDMADVNGAIRKQLDARRISFAPMDTALQLTDMEYGGITPLGLPADWPILVDEAVMKNDLVIIGSGIRGSKIAVKTRAFDHLPTAKILKITKSSATS
jgi:prolyl-tRNA editing enzyme YbaK/EbsC (Cys-tRNA(Pro) deacylase)